MEKSVLITTESLGPLVSITCQRGGRHLPSLELRLDGWIGIVPIAITRIVIVIIMLSFL